MGITVITKEGGAGGSGGGFWDDYILLTQDASILNTTTLTAIEGMSINLEANAEYLFSINWHYDNNGQSGVGSKISLATSGNVTGWSHSLDGYTSNSYFAVPSPFGVASTAAASISRTNASIIQGIFFIKTGGTSDTLVLKHAQQTAHATKPFYTRAGTHILYKKTSG